MARLCDFEYVAALEEAHHDSEKKSTEARLARINELAVSLRDGIGTGPHVSGLRTLVHHHRGLPIAFSIGRANVLNPNRLIHVPRGSRHSQA